MTIRRMARNIKNLPANLTWWLLVKLTKIWANRYMDQFEFFKFQSEHYGTVFVQISKNPTASESFYDKAD